MALTDYARTLPAAQPRIGQPGGAPLDDFAPAPVSAAAPQPTFPGLAGIAGDPSRALAVRLPAAIGSSLADQGRGLVQSAWGAATLPGDVARGLVDPNSPEAVRRSTDLAGLLTLPAVDAGAVADPNALGIFAGAKAKTADLGALATAQDLAAKGADKTAIWNQTGWFTGADGAWRFEIPDDASQIGTKALDNLTQKMTPQGMSGANQSTAPGILWHKPLYDAYPDLRTTDVDARYNSQLSNTSGSFSPNQGANSPRPIVNVQSNALDGPNSVRTTLLHELQHNVQGIEGFAPGSSPEAMKLPVLAAQGQLNTMNGALDIQPWVKEAGGDVEKGIAGYLADHPEQRLGKAYLDTIRPYLSMAEPELEARYEAASQLANAGTPAQAYGKAAGEVESRNTESRMNMTPAQRQATPPWLTQDTPNEQQIVRLSPGGPQLSLTPVDHDPFAGTTETQPVQSAQPSITAYHGSPHSFDQFDLSKIGTGEGAQAYGHGLYFAGNEDVAKSYRNALSSDALQMPDGSVQRANTMGDLEELSPKLKDILEQNGANDKLPNNVRQLTMSSDVHSLIDDAFYNADNTNPNRNMLESAVDYLRTQADDPAHMDGVSSKDLRDVKSAYGLAAERLASLHEQIKPVAGSMYQVAINADPEHFLDWDKPLSEQHPVVHSALTEFGAGHDSEIGGDAYYKMMTKLYDATPESAAQHLRDRGVPGIKYLDAGSRSAGDGSRNYVVFSPENLRILKKYGLAGLGIGAGGAALTGQPQPAQAAGVTLTPVQDNPFAGTQ